MFPKIKLLWAAEPESGWEDEYIDAIQVREDGALYRYDDRACLTLIEPTDTPGLYRIDGADLPMITDASLEDVARALMGMSALEYLLKVLPNVMLPDEIPL